MKTKCLEKTMKCSVCRNAQEKKSTEEKLLDQDKDFSANQKDFGPMTFENFICEVFS